MKIRWNVEDGYITGPRPNFSEIDDEELEYCNDIDDAMNMIMDWIDEDFRDSISWSFDYEKVKKEVEEKFGNKFGKY